MKVILSGIAACAILALAVGVVLRSDQRYAYESFATEGARVTPTDNLVGQDWSGLPTRKQIQNEGANPDTAARNH